MLDTNKIRNDFPILAREVNGKPLVYLDSAATSQKPQQVIDAMVDYFQNHNANVHRGVHQLSDESTALLDESRKQISGFFGAEPQELIFTRNTTEAINGIAYGWADNHLHEGDIILTSIMEHHSNLVVWQQAAERTGASLEFLPIDENEQIDLEKLDELFGKHGEKIKLITLVYVSNTLGTVNPVKEIMSLVKKHFSANNRPRILLDGAQAAPHLPIDFKNLDADFFAFSGHKMLGPMGVGGVLVKNELLETGELQPWLFGGGMIAEVYERTSTFHPDVTERFTAGTPDVASIVGLAAACQYLQELGMQNVKAHDQGLVRYALETLSELKRIEIVGPEGKEAWEIPSRIGSVTFLYDGVHAHDVSQVLDSEGIAVRSGHHCNMPLHDKLNWIATVRASFQVYTTKSEIDALVDGLHKVEKVFY